MNPTIWGEPEYTMLIEMLTTAMCANGAKWDNWRCHPTMWSVNGVDTRKIEPSLLKSLKALAEIHRNPSPLAISAVSQPIFEACSILAMQGNAGSRDPSTTASSASGSKDLDHVTLAKTMLARIVKERPKEGAPPEKKVNEDHARDPGGQTCRGEPQEEGEGPTQETREAHRRRGGLR